jgi:hypothetical protein
LVTTLLLCFPLFAQQKPDPNQQHLNQTIDHLTGELKEAHDRILQLSNQIHVSQIREKTLGSSSASIHSHATTNGSSRASTKPTSSVSSTSSRTFNLTKASAKSSVARPMQLNGRR